MAQRGKGRQPGAWQSSTAYKAILRAVIEARKAAGLSQMELADRLKKPQSWVGKIEIKERRLDIAEFIAISRALGLDEADFLRSIAGQLHKRLDI